MQFLLTYKREGRTDHNPFPVYLSPDAVMPDFAQVYSFIGSVFDPYATDHLQRLKRMDPINVETVCV